MMVLEVATLWPARAPVMPLEILHIAAVGHMGILIPASQVLTLSSSRHNAPEPTATPMMIPLAPSLVQVLTTPLPSVLPSPWPALRENLIHLR